MISDRNYCYVCRVGVTYNEEKIRFIKKYRLFIIIMSKLKEIFNYALTSIQIVTNFGYITIEKVTKRDLENLNGVILNLILMNTFINFVGMTNNSSELLEN